MYRYLTASIVLFLLMPLPSSALKAKSKPPRVSSPDADTSGPDGKRTTPKYFVEAYELGSGKAPSHKTSTETKTPTTATKDQNIHFGLIGVHRESDQPFRVQAVSDPGLPVTISVKSGPATLSDVTTVPDPNLPEKVVTEATVTVADAGTVVLEANQPGDAKYKALKAPITASFRVAEDHDYCLPGLVPRKTSTPEEKKPSSRQANAIVAALGNPVPFLFEAAGSKHILIYSSRWPLNGKEQADLAHIKQQIAQLAQIPDLPPPPPPPASSDSASSPPEDDSVPKAHAPAYRLEVQVPHAGALGDLKQRIDALGRDADFTVEDIGSDKVLITAAEIPPCHDVTLFLQDIRHLAWQTVSQPAVAQVYHLDPSEVAQSLGGGGGDKTEAGSPKQTEASAPTPAEPAAESSKTSKGPSGKTSGKGGSTKGSTGQKTGSSQKDTASDSADDPPAEGDSGADDTTAASGDQAKADISDDNSASASKPSASVTLVDPDLLLLSGAGRGDDAGIPEKRRILAQLDLPRPVMLISAWSMQASTNKPEEIGEFKTGVERAVSMFNDGLQQVLFRGWSYLKDKMADPAYFEPQFYRYLVGRFVGDPQPQDQNPLRPPDQLAEDALGNRLAKKLDVDRNALGICRPDEYCLGYTNIFEPLQPRFTDLLVGIVAANDPGSTAIDAINFVECGATAPCVGARAPQEDCGALDDALYEDHTLTPPKLRPRVYLECFREAVQGLLVTPPKAGAGQARAAIADFLFNYKMSQQYPHDFDPYFLTLSAQNLDSTLAPFIDAFNRDITAYQQFLREQIGYCGNPKSEHQDACLFGNWFGEPAATFINDGLISVRTLSRTEATVSAQTQNYLSDTEAPTLADFLSSLSGGSTASKPSSGKGGGAKAAGAAGAADALQGLEPLPVQLGLKALTMAQSSQVQIGKSLFLDVKPHSLPGASSAEIEVTMKADDTAPPVKWVAGQSKSTDANVSRVAAHDTTTSVRVDSIKLFEISSFSAELEKSRSRIPILPVPFLEVPYIGSILGIPRAGAKEYHSSTAVLSAIVVPTASDLAFGLTFTFDRVVDAGHAGNCRWLGAATDDHPYLCRLRKAQSLSDLDAPIGQFHRLKVACLGTGSLAAHPLLTDDEATIPSWPADACKKLSFESAILQDAN